MSSAEASGVQSANSKDKVVSNIQEISDVDSNSSGRPEEGFVVKQDDAHEFKRAQIVDQPVTGKWEMIGYAFYYFANNSSGPYAYTPTAFQNLLNQAGWDADLPGKQPCSDSTSTCLVQFGGARSLDSVVLISQGIGFALQTVVFLFLGAFADYGSWGPMILVGLSVLSWGVQFGFLGAHDGSKYKVAFGLSVLSSLGYQGCQSFWTAIFPRLARNLPSVREAETKMINGEITEEDYHQLDSYYRNKITNYCWAFSNLGMIIVYAVAIGILFALHSRESTASNNWGISVAITWANVFWIVFGIPWFFLEKKRTNQELPAGANFFTIGFKQLAYCFKSFRILKQCGLYLLSYWLLGDGLNTALNIESILQNEVISYDMIDVSYLYMLQAGASIIGMGVFWWAQKFFKLSTRTMYIIVSVFITLFTLYGLIGSWTGAIGFHNFWEVWFYNVYMGLFISPYYAYSSTMMSEVCPRGKEFIFFAIFSTINKTSSFIGPFVTSAIIDRTGNTNTGFSFCFALCIISLVLAMFLNQSAARRENEEFLLDEKRRIANGESMIF